MKKIITLSFFLIFLWPQFAAAQLIDDCDAGEALCLCSLIETSTGTAIAESTVDYPVSSLQECRDHCESVNVAGNVNHYTVQCEIDGVLTPLDNGAITSAGAAESAESYYAPPELGVEIPGLTFSDSYKDGNYVTSNYIGEYVQALYAWLLGAGALLAVVMIMIGGVQYALARGQQGAIKQATDRMSNAVIGLILLLGAYTIAFTIDPSLTKFGSLSIQSVDKIEFIPNETGFGFADYDWDVVETVGNGMGWNGVPMWNQRAYSSSPYGPTDCLGANEGSVESSGCGVTSMAMVLSYFGPDISPPTVATSFWNQTVERVDNGQTPFRPTGAAWCPQKPACGCNGTYSDAFIESELLNQYGLEARFLQRKEQQAVLDLLDQGKILIYLYRTQGGGGHYVVLAGRDNEGNILVNNPYGGLMEKRTVDQVFPIAKFFVYIDTVSAFIPE